MTQPKIEGDLNTVIVSAVNARVEAEMMKALSGDETIGRFVVAALRQNIEVQEPGTYHKHTEPFLRNVLRKAIQEATVAAVQRLVAEELPTIEEEVRKALRRDVKQIAETLTNSLARSAASPYGVKVDLSLLMPRGDE